MNELGSTERDPSNCTIADFRGDMAYKLRLGDDSVNSEILYPTSNKQNSKSKSSKKEQIEQLLMISYSCCLVMNLPVDIVDRSSRMGAAPL